MNESGTIRTAIAALIGLATTVTCLSWGSPAQAGVTMGIAPTVIVNEVSTTNFSGAADEKGKRGDWVELFNTTGAAIDLSGWGLSNGTKNPFRWVFPAGTTIAARGYLRVWTDKADRTASTANLHTNFNIDNGADSAVLSAPNLTVTGQLVDSVTPPRLRPDVSWCRTVTGDPSSAFTTCLAPTPGAANSGATAGALLATPTLSVLSGVYASAQTITATGPAGATLRYTTDGSAPIETSPVATGPITIGASTVLRVAAFQTGMLTSYSASATYIIDGSGKYNGQRILFVTMKPNEKNSYTAGGRAPSQGWQSVVEMIGPAGDRAFAADAATEQAGQLGSRNGQKTLPMDIKFTDALGVKDVSYPIFSTKPTTTKFKKLRLRNAGDDYQEAHLRDQFWQHVGTEVNLMPAAYEPVQVFLNGSYYGMMDLREKEDEGLVESTLKVDRDNTDFLSDTRVLNGDNAKANFDAVYSFVTGNDMSVAANYAKATTMIDVENIAQDFALHMFAADGDWAWRNVHYYSAPDYDGKWRWRMHDIDISSDGTDAWGFNIKPSRDMNDRYGYTQGALVRALLKNPGFKTLYANVIADQLNSILLPSYLSAQLDPMAAKMAPYLPNHIALNGQPTSMTKWTAEIERLRTFFTARQPFYDQHTRSYLGLGARNVPVTIAANDTAMGTVKVNTLDLTTRLTAAAPTWTGNYWSNVPVTLEAKPRPGFVFVGWQGASIDTARAITVTPAAAGASYTAVFAPATASSKATIDPIGAQTATTSSLFKLQVNATDANGYKLTYSAKSLPSGLDIHPVTGLVYGKPTKAGTFNSVITVANGSANATINATWTITNKIDRNVGLPVTITGDGTGLTATYFANTAFTGTPLVTRVENPAVNLGAGGGPVTGTATSNWAIRWTGKITTPVTGTYSLQALLKTDDGVRVYVNGVKVIDAWTTNLTAPAANVDLVANTPTPIVIEFQDKSGAASLQMAWKLPLATSYSPILKGVLTP